MTERIAYCAPGLEIPARFAVIAEARDIDDATAEIRPHPWLRPGDVIMTDPSALAELVPDAVQLAPLAPTYPRSVIDARCLLTVRPPAIAVITSIC